MRHRIWLLVLLVAMGMACAKTKEDISGTSPADATTDTQMSKFALKVTFEGLVGYVNQADNVWALLPKASGGTMPPKYDYTKPIDYPEHYAVLKVNGKNIKGFGIPIDIQIPINDKEIEVAVGGGTGYGVPFDPFRQIPNDPVDKLDATVLTTPHPKLTARVKLPLLPDEKDWLIEEEEVQGGGVHDFVNVKPKKVTDFCKEPDEREDIVDPRVQAVTWQKRELTGEVTLYLRTLDGSDLFPLVLTQHGEEPTIQVWIFNKEGRGLQDPKYVSHHWPAYRWFYNLSVESDCTEHYYPQGDAGGNRCPQKLYSE